MEGSVVIESLDSLWYYVNVLSSRAQRLGLAPADDEHETQKGGEPVSQPVSAVAAKQRDEPPVEEVLVPKCPRCGEFAMIIEQPQVIQWKQPVQAEAVEFTSGREDEEEERRRRRNRRSRRRRRKRRVVVELDVGGHGFHRNMNSGPWQTSTAYQFAEQVHHMKIPSLNDGIAMKEHLRSWAHAVACTVR